MLRFALVAAAMACMAAPAHAQSDFWAGVTADVIGQTISNSGARDGEIRCLSGRNQAPERRLVRIRESAQETMAAYLALAAANERADVSGAFSRREQTWQRISEGSKSNDVSAVSDPLAGIAGSLGQPEQFMQAGDGRTAAGLWVVRGNDNGPVGFYRGVFLRERGAWRLARLEIGEGAEAPQALTPYCHSLGDVDAYLSDAEAPELEARESEEKPAQDTSDAAQDTLATPSP